MKRLGLLLVWRRRRTSDNGLSVGMRSIWFLLPWSFRVVQYNIPYEEAGPARFAPPSNVTHAPFWKDPAPEAK